MSSYVKKNDIVCLTFDSLDVIHGICLFIVLIVQWPSISSLGNIENVLSMVEKNTLKSENFFLQKQMLIFPLVTEISFSSYAHNPSHLQVEKPV